MDPFQDRVAVITGGAGGIGAAMAKAFAERGAKIVLADLDEPALAGAVRELEKSGAQVIGVHTDVSKPESVEALAEATLRRFGAAHIVCNNAGIATFGPIAKSTRKDWEFTMSVNFWGVVNGVQAFVPRLIAQNQGGHVINTASMAGLVGMRWLGVYCASKFAVVGLTESLFVELRDHGIGASVLCPMMVATNINANSLRMRPAALRNPAGSDIAQTGGGAPPLVGGTVQPRELALRVVRAVERRELYILTHPEQREILKRRASRLDAAFNVWELECS
ncbi:MAG TPA: SDR family NAD(P)-dependent oxidoreductase [Myxococcota bacterium]|nr:SDR family NAD(P)-dependent oxidoreductase [Myxococcota bacterium]